LLHRHASKYQLRRLIGSPREIDEYPGVMVLSGIRLCAAIKPSDALCEDDDGFERRGG
jgi:hypothetical protein